MSGRFGPVDTEDGDDRRDPVASAQGADGDGARDTDAAPTPEVVFEGAPEDASEDAAADADADTAEDAPAAAQSAHADAAAARVTADAGHPVGAEPLSDRGSGGGTETGPDTEADAGPHAGPDAEAPLPLSGSDRVAEAEDALAAEDAEGAPAPAVAREGNGAGNAPLLLRQSMPAARTPEVAAPEGTPQGTSGEAPKVAAAPAPDAPPPDAPPPDAPPPDATPRAADAEGAERDPPASDHPSADELALDDDRPASLEADNAGPAENVDADGLEPLPQDTTAPDARSVWDAPPVDARDTEAEAAEEAEGITASDPWDAATLRAAADDGAPYLAAPGAVGSDGATAVAEPPPSPVAAADPAPEPAPAPEPEPEPVEMALFGKLAARGDFITRNVPRPLQRPLEDWLSRVMNGSREVLGAHWDQAYISAPAWFFWIGAEAFEDARSFAANNLQSTQIGVLTGVLVPSADRLGRRFPLTLLLGGARARALPPPTIGAPDHRWYGALAERALHFRQAPDLAPVEAALGAMPGPRTRAEYAEAAAVPPGQPLWAQAGYGGLAEMWHDLSQADHALAASGRSYWWTGGMAAGAVRDDQGAPSAEGCGAQVISVTGLPDPDVFAFMLRCQAT
ncbi:MAG: type VI secretion system-associated protein TagF [Rhodobacteraceae bacterium]|nr:type VI secretion system-associated protein TagF [Paracoccaceae bacterium]